MAGIWGALQVGLSFTTFAGLLVGAGLYALATPIARHLFHDLRLVAILRLASLMVPFEALSVVLASATRGFNKMQYATGAQQIVRPLTRLVVIAPMALSGLTAGKATMSYIVGSIVTCVALLFFLDRLFPLKRPLRAGRRDTRKILLFSLPAYFSSLVDTLGPYLQPVLLGSLSTITTVGVFAAAGQLSMVSSAFNQSIGTASSPIISELHDRGNREQMARFYQTTTKWMFAANLPLFLIMLLFAKTILAIFGKEFVEGSTALIILAGANLVVAGVGIADGILAMTGNTPAKSANSVVSVVLTIGLSLLLIPRWGVVGAATAALLATAGINLLRVSQVFALFRMLPYNVGFLKPIAAGLVALAIGWSMRQLLHSETHLLLSAISASATLVAYLIVLLLLGLSPEDQTVLAHIRERIGALFSRRR